MPIGLRSNENRDKMLIRSWLSDNLYWRLIRFLRVRPDTDPVNIGCCFSGRVFGMNSLLKKIMTVPFLSILLLSFGVSQLLVLPLLAGEFTNISNIKECRAIKGDAERLLCYDTVSDGGIFNEQQLKQVQVEKFGSSTMRKKPAPVTSTAPATATPTIPKTVTPTADISGDKLAVTITRTQKAANGIHYFQTSDGQVWKQRNAGSWSTKVPFEAVIKAGILGSFFLVNEGGKSTRVKRVK